MGKRFNKTFTWTSQKSFCLCKLDNAYKQDFIKVTEADIGTIILIRSVWEKYHIGKFTHQAYVNITWQQPFNGWFIEF